MRSVIETIYGWVKGYMLKKATSSGKTQYIVELTNAFATIEKIWKLVVELKEQQKTK